MAARQAKTTRRSNRNRYIALVSVVVAVVAVAALWVYMSGSRNVSFQTFDNNFNSASRVAVYYTEYNGSVGSAIECESLVIEAITPPNQQRNASTIDLFGINQSTCVAEHGVRGSINYTNESVAACLAYSKTEPSVFINYSSANGTIIRPDALYFFGDSAFLSQCAIATDLR